MRTGNLTAPILACLVFMVDLFSKQWALSHLGTQAKVVLIPHILQMTLTTNTGGAFGIGKEHGWLMSVLALGLTIAICVWALKREGQAEKPDCLERLGIGFILGGACGNLYNRFTLGKVTDFLEFSFISFPVFNIADVSIDIGLVLILLRAFVKEHHLKQPGAKPITKH